MTQVPLKLLVDPRRPITYGIVQAGPDTPDGVPYIRPTDMTQTSGVTDPARLLRTTPEIAATYKRSQVLPGDVVLSIGPSYGKVMIVPPELRGANLTQGTARLAPAPGVTSRFLYWALQSKPARDYWNMAVAGATFRALNLEPLSLTPMFKVDSDKQGRIADFLDNQVAYLDEAVVRRGSQIETLSEWTLAAVSEILAPPARSSDGHPNLPWLSTRAGTLTKLATVCTLQSGVTVDSGRTAGKEYPYLRVANVQNGSIHLDEVKRIVVRDEVAPRSLLRAGDVLMTEGGDIDKLGRGSVWHGEIDPCLHQNHVFALRPDTSALLPEYLAAMTRTHHARCYFESTGSQSTNLASTNSSKVLAFRFPLPSVAVQAAKLREVQANDESADRLTSALRTQVRLLQERKQALITAAVTGQFDVTTARSVA